MVTFDGLESHSICSSLCSWDRVKIWPLGGLEIHWGFSDGVSCLRERRPLMDWSLSFWAVVAQIAKAMGH